MKRIFIDQNNVKFNSHACRLGLHCYHVKISKVEFKINTFKALFLPSTISTSVAHHQQMFSSLFFRQEISEKVREYVDNINQ